MTLAVRGDTLIQSNHNRIDMEDLEDYLERNGVRRLSCENMESSQAKLSRLLRRIKEKLGLKASYVKHNHDQSA